MGERRRRVVDPEARRGWPGQSTNVRLAPTDAAPPVELIAEVDDLVTVIHGTRARFIKPSAAGKLHGAAADPSRLELVDGMGHAYVLGVDRRHRDSGEWALALRPKAAQPPGQSVTSLRLRPPAIWPTAGIGSRRDEVTGPAVVARPVGRAAAASAA